jgi:hypothetical protein
MKNNHTVVIISKSVPTYPIDTLYMQLKRELRDNEIHLFLFKDSNRLTTNIYNLLQFQDVSII